jgi:hypothetical protein
MCIYVQGPLDEPVTYLVHPTPAGSKVLYDTTATGPVGNTFYNYPYFGYTNQTVTNVTTPPTSIEYYNSFASPLLPNSLYGGEPSASGTYTRGMHPSDVLVGYDKNLKVPPTSSSVGTKAMNGYIYLDQVFAVGNGTSGYSKTLESTTSLGEYKKTGVFADGGGHMFGYATCHWIRSCTGSEVLGSPCSGTLSGVDYDGYCFSSDTGSLECGHLTAIDNEYGEKPVAFDASPTVSGVASATSTGAAEVVSPNILPAQAGIVPISDSILTVKASSPGEDGSGGPGKPYRCPAGSPAKSLGSYVSKRMLVAGCMIPTDANYDDLAEVHVPAYCDVPYDYKAGCLIPWAENFDPTAKQSAKCLFKLKGCTDATALNYNSEATENDPDEPCIVPVYGCTVNSSPYAGVDSDTPAYRSSFFGYNWRVFTWYPGGTGKVETNDNTGKYSGFDTAAAYPGTITGKERPLAVKGPPLYSGPKAYNSAANTMSTEGCVVAVEGCMDASAANYDSEATVNTNSWCIPAVNGCMMPDAANAIAIAPNGDKVAFSSDSGPVDGLNPTWDPLVTVHKPNQCSVARYGCMESAALNYDPLANVPRPCAMPLVGCLHPNATNYGCRNPDGGIGKCYINVTVHEPYACKFAWEYVPYPPSPPSPLLPAGIDASLIKTFEQVKTQLIVSGSVADFPDNGCHVARNLYSKLNNDVAACCTCASLNSEGTGKIADTTNANLQCLITGGSIISSLCQAGTVRAASVSIDMVEVFEDAAAAQAQIVATQQSLGSTTDSLQAALGGNLGITFLRPAETTTVTIVTVLEDGSVVVAVNDTNVTIAIEDIAESNVGAIVGGVVGGVCGVLLLLGIAYYCYRKNKASKPVYPA